MKATNNKIVWLLSRGFTAKQIGEKFGLSDRTIEKKIEAMKSAYELKNTTHLVAHFLRLGIIK